MWYGYFLARKFLEFAPSRSLVHAQEAPLVLRLDTTSAFLLATPLQAYQRSFRGENRGHHGQIYHTH